MNDASFFKSVKPEQFIDALLDISPDALLLVDPDFRIIRANPMALELLEISGEDLSNTSLLNHFSSAKSRLKRLSARVQKNGEGTVGRLRLSVNPDRKTNFHITAKLIEAGGSEVMLLTCSDSTEPSPAEKKLKESEEKFSTLLQNMHEGVMLVDNDDRIQYVNDRIMTMLGYDRDELVGEVGYRILFSEEYQKIIQEKNRLRTKRVADTYEVEMLANGGETLWVQISGAPIVDAAGKVVGSFGILTDITERKASEAALQSAKSELEKRVKERTRELTAMNDSLMREIYERKQVEEERQKFFSLVENSSDLIVMADPDSGKLIYANKAALRALGQSQKGSLDRQTIFDCHPADLQERLATEILPSITEAGNWHGELPFFNNESGEELPTLFNGFAVKHPLSDDLIAIAIIYRDVRELKNQEAALQVAKNELETRVQERTAELSEANQILMQQIVVRRRAEEELQNSEEKYRLLFNSGNDSVFAFHAESNGELSNFIEVNDVACQKLGYGREELLALSMRSIVIGYRQEDMKGRLRRLLSEQHILFEETFLTRAGVAIPMEISAHLFTFRDRPTIMAIARDITNRKRAETQIRDQAALLDKAQDAIMVCDLNDYVIYWNKSAERLYGWKNQEAIGNNAFELLFQRDSTQYISSRRAVLEHGEWLGELHQVTKEGREILVESRWTLVHDNTGEAKSILVVNTDITEKKLIEVQFLRAQRMESIGALAGGIAHDLNNVLAPILTAVQILQVRFTDDKSEKILNTIESNVKRGADMVKQILTFARGVEGERIPLHIQHLIHDLEKITLETFPKSITI
ncbi:MAG TPA: PAS domain S-box protein, partial [Calditrichia bacterium]|nr:PAS domain S-box protein [Calditrichia bacterium]